MDEEQEDSSQNQNNENQASSSTESQTRSLASRIRRLVSQSTMQENDLDNSILNSQQQFVDIESPDPDEVAFEEYMRTTRQNAEETSLQALLFDDELPMNHTYLGDLDRISGTNVYEPGKVYEIPVCSHHSLVFPGEIVPMIMIAQSIFSRTPDTNEGLTFGLLFTDEVDSNNLIYGVTCQVFEKGIDEHGHITLKSKAHQRFVVVEDDDTGTMATMRNQSFYAKVRILPEYSLPDPVSLSLSNNQMKHTQSSTLQMRKLLASSHRWPKFVYDHYSVVAINEKIERYMAMLNLEAPEDPILKSFWLARNVPLNQSDRMKIFTSNCVNKRMMLMGESLNFMCSFSCKRCKTQIACYSDIFAMAKGNVNANYCNPAGYIHETLTVKKVLDDSLSIVERPSTDFSWFPGYAWQIAICAVCSSHIGWKFTAKNLKPKSFFGLSCKSLIVSPEGDKNKQQDSNSDDSSSDEN